MKMELEQLLPGEIERRSFEIITEELGERTFPKEQEDIIKRVIHTTADFEYADTMTFSKDAVSSALSALKDRGRTMIVTDTNMTRSGIHRASLEKLGIEAVCYMADPDVAREAKEQGMTRAAVSMNKAARTAEETGKRVIFSVGNAPTALIAIEELIREGRVHPALVIGVPVGFVNVVQAKERIMTADVPYIVAKGRKGGSTVAAAILNALLYKIDTER
nr:precorrin-8X methylmutase [uncultured Sellimonas sp.]